MARTYRYSLSGGIIIEVIDNWGPLNEWKEVGESGKLLDTEGGLRSLSLQKYALLEVNR
jgi:hypothetical protein